MKINLTRMYCFAKVVIEKADCKVLQLRNLRNILPYHINSQSKDITLSRNYSQSKDTEIHKKNNKESINNKGAKLMINSSSFKTDKDIEVHEKESKELADNQKKSFLKEIINFKKDLDLKPMFPSKETYSGLMYWDERSRLQTVKKEFKKQNKVKGMTDYFIKLYNIRSFPKNFTELFFFIKKYKLKKKIINQSYVFQRVAVLKPDLAAAHFIIYRGGSVKFVDKDWIGPKEARKLLPNMYIPFYLVEGINAEGTDLIKEGLSNLTDLRYLKWLSLKGLNSVNDWFLDWVSKEYHETLEYLDISNCKNVTYRGFSCFYRFEKLKTLRVEGVSDSPDFKVACLMLFDIFPHLEIEGINLEIPQEIKLTDEEKIQEIKNDPKEEEDIKYLKQQNNVS